MSDEILSKEELDALVAEGTAQDAASTDGDAGPRAGDNSGSLTQANVRMVSEPVVRSVEFGQIGYPNEKIQKSGVDLIMDVNVQVSVELGRSVMQVRDVLALGPGSVVELDKHAGEPVEVVVNNKMVARGEVVVIDENFGVRITEIVNAKGKESNAQAA
jgi:flagellar motor switch protein FliN/FliY